VVIIDLSDLLLQYIPTQKTQESQAQQGLTLEEDGAEPNCAAQSDEAAKIVAHLSKARVVTSEVLSELRACKLAAVRISKRYFRGRQILFRSVDGAIEELSEAASRCAEKYNSLLDRRIWFSQRPGESCKIDFTELEQMAQNEAEDKAANLIDYAATMMRLAFGEQSQVLDELIASLNPSQEFTETASQNSEATQPRQSLRDLMEDDLGVNLDGGSEGSERFAK